MAPQIYVDPLNFLKKDYVYAVTDASNDKVKRGFTTYYALKSAGYKVYPINSQETRMQDDPCYPNLTQLRPFADVVVLTVSFDEDEERGLEVVREMRDLGISSLWIERGCETDEIRHFLELEHMEFVEGYSIVEELEKLKKSR